MPQELTSKNCPSYTMERWYLKIVPAIGFLYAIFILFITFVIAVGFISAGLDVGVPIVVFVFILTFIITLISVVYRYKQTKSDESERSTEAVVYSDGQPQGIDASKLNDNPATSPDESTDEKHAGSTSEV